MTGSSGARLDRALGALVGLALGDALGMPTQSFSPEQIRERYGRIDGLVDAATDQPIAPGMPAGAVTDDTDQALIVADLVVAGDGLVDAHAFAEALVRWEQVMVERGSLDLLGPSTKAALARLQEGTPIEETGRTGTTNGAAMRIAPVGIAHRAGAGLLDAVVAASRVTHHTGLGIAGAAAIGAAVSAGVDGADIPTALEAAVVAAREGSSRGSWVAGADVAARFTAGREHARRLPPAELEQFLHDVVGTSVQSQESVVAALLVVEGSAEAPFAALCSAASLGGDTDTIAAMSGAVLGAVHGASAFPAEAVSQVLDVNGLDLAPVARRLLAVRDASTKMR